MPLRGAPPGLPQGAPEQRELQVLVDQLANARCVGSYLPQSEDPALAALLQALDQRPGDERLLAELWPRKCTAPSAP
jgi:hypothetical protein